MGKYEILLAQHSFNPKYWTKQTYSIFKFRLGGDCLPMKQPSKIDRFGVMKKFLSKQYKKSQKRDINAKRFIFTQKILGEVATNTMPQITEW